MRTARSFSETLYAFKKLTATERTPAAFSLAAELGDVCGVDTLYDRTVREDAFFYFEGERAGDERFDELDLRVVHVVAVLVANGENVGKALGHK